MSVSLFNNLSDELILATFVYLSERDLANCLEVCRRWNTLSKDKSLWAQISQIKNIHLPEISYENFKRDRDFQRKIKGLLLPSYKFPRRKLFEGLPKGATIGQTITVGNKLVSFFQNISERIYGVKISSFKGDYFINKWEINNDGMNKIYSISPHEVAVVIGHEIKIVNVNNGLLKNEICENLNIKSFDSDGQAIYFGLKNGTIKKWEWETGGLESIFEAGNEEANEILDLKVHGNLLGVVNRDGNFVIYDLNNDKKILFTLSVPVDSKYRFVKFEGNFLIVSGEEKTSVFDLKNFKCLKTFMDTPRLRENFCKLVENRYFVIAGYQQHIEIWDSESNESKILATPVFVYPSALKLNQIGSALIGCNHQSGSVYEIDYRRGKWIEIVDMLADANTITLLINQSQFTRISKNQVEIWNLEEATTVIPASRKPRKIDRARSFISTKVPNLFKKPFGKK